MKQVVLGSLLLMTSMGCELEARCSRGLTALGFAAGALTGAALAGVYDNVYYYDIPAYDYAYPGIPLFVYDYPTYQYAPVYAYQNTRYTIYPSYYLAY